MSEPLVEMGPRMSDAGEGLMWRLEKDPYLSSTVANLTVLDSPPDMERLAQRMLRATRIVPRLRQRVQPALGLQPPVWVDDVTSTSPTTCATSRRRARNATCSTWRRC